MFAKLRMRYDANCSNCGKVEVNKPMAAAFPVRHTCGGRLARVYSPLPVFYHSPGFTTYDYTRPREQVGATRFAKFEHERDDIERRAKAGKLTQYEMAAESD